MTMAMANILETKMLTKRFGGIVANHGINLKIEEGKTTGLIGPNGSGKTTFINQVSGIFPPTSGNILFRGEEISKKPACKIASMGIARTFQRIQLFNHLNVVENVLVSRCKFMSASALDVALGTAKVRREEEAQFDKEWSSLAYSGWLKMHGSCL